MIRQISIGPVLRAAALPLRFVPESIPPTFATVLAVKLTPGQLRPPALEYTRAIFAYAAAPAAVESNACGIERQAPDR